jgi:hypothetical protein
MKEFLSELYADKLVKVFIKNKNITEAEEQELKDALDGMIKSIKLEVKMEMTEQSMSILKNAFSSMGKT